MKTLYKLFCCFVGGCLLQLSLCAQQTEKVKVMAAMRSVSEHYKKTPALSLDINYRFAEESKPTVYLDSVKGRLILNGENFWCSMDSTESMRNQDYALMLFKEDNLMYVTKAASGSRNMHPLSVLDSLLQNPTGFSCTLTESKGYQLITLIFPPGRSYKRIDYLLNTQSGFLERMTSFVQASQLYEPSVRNLLESTPTYAIVEARFEHYRTDNVDLHFFDTERYFTIHDREYKVTATYHQYKIFFGSPDL